MPAELVEGIISFVPPIVQVVRYKVATAPEKSFDGFPDFEGNLQGHYTVTFVGSVAVGVKASVTAIIIDMRKDRQHIRFPTLQYMWDTKVIDVSDDGVTLERGAEKGLYTIRKQVVCGRLH